MKELLGTSSSALPRARCHVRQTLKAEVCQLQPAVRSMAWVPDMGLAPWLLVKAAGVALVTVKNQVLLALVLRAYCSFACSLCNPVCHLYGYTVSSKCP